MRFIVSQISLLALVAACAEAPVEEIDILSASVAGVEDAPNARLVEWNAEPADRPVSLTIASPTPADVIGEETIEGGSYSYKSEKNERTYFTIIPEGGEPVTTALRVLPFEGGRNFRDLGGYETEDGRTVKWGLVYRSGVMNALTDADYDFIAGLGIETVVDFRANEERHDEPTQWRASAEPEFLTWDYASSSNSDMMRETFMKEGVTPADVTAMMAGFYGEMLYQHSDKFAAMFDRLIEDDAPLAFHCSAGKDRTGVAAALVLTALGVDRETVIADYAMTEKVVDYEAAFASDEVANSDSPYAFLARLPRELVRPLLRSDPVFIMAAMERMEKDHGSAMGYIEKELGVTPAEIERLRARLTE